MVIKKPYAFLIKHFRLIHGLVFALLVFLMIRSVTIYGFFSDYAANHTYINQTNLASFYVTPFMYLITVIAILVLFVIYFILSIKEKSNRIYLAGILYYILLLIFFIYMHSVFVGLEEKSLDLETIRLFRDISLIVLIPQVVFLFIIAGRTLGFNIKQFEFKKDLEEMQIDVTDNEEVELTLGNDTYKIARTFRKFIRLSKYFVLENKLFVIAVSSIFVFGIALFVYNRISVYQESHGQKEDVQIKSLLYKVNESYITKGDLYNEVINPKYSYVLVNISVTNKSGLEYKLNRDTFKLEVNKELKLPVYNVANSFYDLGNTFEPCDIKAGVTNEYIVMFAVENEYIEKNDKYTVKEFLFKIKNLTVDKNDNHTYYEDFVVKPINLNETTDKGTYKLPNKVTFNDSLLKNSILDIESYAVSDRFKETYYYEINNKKEKGTYIVAPTETNKEALTLLKLKARLTLDDSTYVSGLIKDPADLFKMYGMLIYRVQGNYMTSKLTKKEVNYDTQTYSYLEVPKEVEEANKIDLIILVRGVKYTINLK